VEGKIQLRYPFVIVTLPKVMIIRQEIYTSGFDFTFEFKRKLLEINKDERGIY